MIVYTPYLCIYNGFTVYHEIKQIYMCSAEDDCLTETDIACLAFFKTEYVELEYVENY